MSLFGLTLVSKMACLFRRESVLVDHHRECVPAGHVSDCGSPVTPDKRVNYFYYYLCVSLYRKRLIYLASDDFMIAHFRLLILYKFLYSLITEKPTGD